MILYNIFVLANSLVKILMWLGHHISKMNYQLHTCMDILKYQQIPLVHMAFHHMLNRRYYHHDHLECNTNVISHHQRIIHMDDLNLFSILFHPYHPICMKTMHHICLHPLQLIQRYVLHWNQQQHHLVEMKHYQVWIQ